MDHARGRCGTVPVLLVRRNPDDVAGFDLAHFATPALHAPGAGDHEQRLAERMRMPGGARTGLEAHQAGAHPRWRRRFDDRLLPNRAGEALSWSAACRPRTAVVNVHDAILPK